MNSRTLASALTLPFVLALGAAAHASEPEPAEAASATALEAARDRDASIDRGFLSTHADTIGKGNWAINSYELFLLGISYAPTDDLEIALTTSLPIADGMPFVGSLAPKYVFYRTADTAIAVRGIVWYGTVLGESSSIGSFSVGLHLDQYLDHAGRFGLHAALSGGTAFGPGFDSSDLQLASGALFQLDLGFTAGVANVAKLLVEAQIFAAKTSDEFRVAPIVLLNYGIRFHGKGLAADLGFVRPIGDVESGLILGLPFVAFSARF